MPKPNVLALRIRSARAGWVPIPLRTFLDAIGQAVRRAGLRIEWRQADGDPVALISIPPPRRTGGKRVRLAAVGAGDGRISLSGTTE